MLTTSDADAQPEVTFVFPAEGDELAAPPPVIHMCFGSPLNTQDLALGGDFSFKVTGPDGRRLGLRVVFQPDGLGVAIHPGVPVGTSEGQWTFEWRVTDAGTLEPTTGTINYTVSPQGDPLPEEPLSRCLLGDMPPTFATPTSTATGGADDGDDQDILLLSLIATGSLIVAAAIGLILYRFRRRIGFRRHRPPQGEDGGDSD